MPVLMPGESHGQKNLGGYSPWGHKESDMTERALTHTHIHTHTYPEHPITNIILLFLLFILLFIFFLCFYILLY